MYCTVYIVKNKVNGKIYIGAHKTENLDDDYMGSGKHLLRSIEKYGKENFEKSYLGIFETPEEMFDLEEKLVNEEFVKNKETYNLKIGGSGGWDHIDREVLYSSDIQSKKSIFCKPDWRKANEKKLLEWCSKGGKVSFEKKKGVHDPNFDKRTFLGKNHTEETKKKISKANANKRLGKNNSQFETKWIKTPDNLKETKINKNELQEWINKGWLPGRKKNCNQSSGKTLEE